ncbi:MAG: hypothetical protein RL748_3515 [Pseudomonadota bacterium]|jgi:hypothetical protein
MQLSTRLSTQLTAATEGVHLTYCTNIHAGESWAEISASLDQTIPSIKAALALPAATPFGIGLRLSAQAAFSLIEPATLQAFQAQLARLGAYVFTINAFPYGPFHGVSVKENVYLPDWRAPERLDYSETCARILAQLLPPGVAGSISTVPGAFKLSAQDGQAGSSASVSAIVRNLLDAVVMLARLEQSSGKCITLALEPEPCCFLETVQETCDFFRQHLWADAAVAQVAQACNSSLPDAADLIRRHLGVCYDVCHAAVEFEDPQASVQSLLDCGIGIAKIQLSCALRIASMQAALLPALQRFDDGVYLHQTVVRQNDGSLLRFVDLPQALAAFVAGGARGEWRIHCHVPIFWQADELADAKPGASVLDSTLPDLRAVLQMLRQRSVSPHLEVETYTWDVLPAHLKTESKAAAISRELAFILRELQA